MDRRTHWERVYTEKRPDQVSWFQAEARLSRELITRAAPDRDAAIICEILNDAWSDNWGFVPFTETEKAYAGKKLKPLILKGANIASVLVKYFDENGAAYIVGDCGGIVVAADDP